MMSRGCRRVKNGGEKNGRERRIRRGRRMRGERRMRRKSVRVRALLRGQILTALTGQRAGPSFRQPVMLGRIWPGIDKTDIRPPRFAERVKLPMKDCISRETLSTLESFNVHCSAICSPNQSCHAARTCGGAAEPPPPDRGSMPEWSCRPDALGAHGSLVAMSVIARRIVSVYGQQFHSPSRPQSTDL